MRSPFPLLAALVLSLSLAACAPAAPQPAASDPPGPEQSAASEEARPLTLDELLAMAEEDRFGQADLSSYSNAMVAGPGRFQCPDQPYHLLLLPRGGCLHPGWPISRRRTTSSLSSTSPGRAITMSPGSIPPRHSPSLGRIPGSGVPLPCL